MSPPLIAYLVKFLEHIFYFDKLDYCISGVSMHCFPHIDIFISPVKADKLTNKSRQRKHQKYIIPKCLH